MALQFDEVGYWSEVKLDIIREYACAYSKILSAQRSPSFSHVYIDAFAGAGMHVSKATHEFILGSPLNALLVEPPFREFHLIDLDSERVDNLRELTSGRSDVHIYEGDCNAVLLSKVFPKVCYENYRRGLCILDPYGLHLNWDVLLHAGQSRTLDIFLNFPVADMNRNVLWRNPDAVSELQAARMTAFWGDETWRSAAYSTCGNLFGLPEKETNDQIAEAFRRRLMKVAGFARVPQPVPMRNSRGAIVYYLFFASQVDTAEKIVSAIFSKYENRGA